MWKLRNVYGGSVFGKSEKRPGREHKSEREGEFLPKHRGDITVRPRLAVILENGLQVENSDMFSSYI